VVRLHYFFCSQSEGARMHRRDFLTLVAAMTAARAFPALAAPQAARLSAEDQSTLQHVQGYLDSIKTVQSAFQQFSGEGNVASGTIYLERPGKMRIVYDDPVPVLIVADGRSVYYWDKKLQELSQIRVEDTPAWFLLRPQIRLSGDVTVTRFERGQNALRISMTETKQPDLGSLVLVLSDRPLELRQWTVIDAQQKPITVALQDPHYGAALNPSLFLWTDQRN
jgi:outer membrane lipoprotein-sorting protein